MWFDIVLHFSMRLTLYNHQDQDLAEENKKLKIKVSFFFFFQFSLMLIGILFLYTLVVNMHIYEIVIKFSAREEKRSSGWCWSGT